MFLVPSETIPHCTSSTIQVLSLVLASRVFMDVVTYLVTERSLSIINRSRVVVIEERVSEPLAAGKECHLCRLLVAQCCPRRIGEASGRGSGER